MKPTQTLKHSVYAHGLRHMRHEMSDTIIVAGARRSGTSWLMELLRTLPGYKSLSEPLQYGEARSFGIDERTFIAPNASHENARVYFGKILTGQVADLSAWHFEYGNPLGRLYEYVKQKRLVVKLCRASGMLSWVGNTFETRGILLIVRHPCAVVASLKRLWGTVREESLCEMLKSKVNQRAKSGLPVSIPTALIERFSEAIARAETRAEKIAVMWCLDHYALFHYYSERTYPWLVVPYEELLTNGSHELQRIEAFLGGEFPRETREQFSIPSFSTRDLHRDPSSQLSKWKNRLSKAEIDQVLRAVESFGLKFYSSDLRPDLIWLSNLQHRDAPPIGRNTVLPE